MTRATQEETELLKRLQGTSNKTDPKTDPFKFIGDFNNIDGLITELDKMRESGKGYVGVFRARLFGLQPITIINTPVAAADGVWNQMLMGCVDIKSDGTLRAQGYIYSVVYRISSINGWGKWQLAGEERIKAILSNDLGNVREELEKRITGTSDATSPWEDSFKKIQDFTDLPSLDDYLKGWHGESIEDYDSDNDGKIDASATKGFVGKFRTNVAGIPIEIFSSVVSYGDKTDKNGDTSVWVQEIKGAIDIDHGGRIQLDNNKFKPFYEDIEVENGATKACVRKYKNVLRFVGRTNNTGGINTLRRIFDGSIGGWGNWINVANPYITSPLYGKNVLVLGGSFAHNTRAYSNSGNTGYGFDEQGRQYALQNYIAKSLGLKRFDNFALAGKGVCIDKFKSNDGKETDLSIFGQLNRAIKCSNDNGYVYDGIIIMGGINDFGVDVPLGKITDPIGNNTFYGSYNKIVDAARKYNKDVKLYMTTPFKAFNNYDVDGKSHPNVYWEPQSIITNRVGVRYQDYVQALKVIAQYKSIPLLDIFSIQQVDSTNYTEYYRVDDKTSNKVNGDAAHPNGKGYKMIASALIDFLAWGKGMETFDFDVLSYKNMANIKANSDSIIAEVNRATIAENDIKNDIIVKIQNVKNEILSDTNDELSELLKRLQGNSTDSISFDPFIKLSWEPRNKNGESDTKPDINDYMNDLCPKVVNKDDGTSEYDYANKTGHFRAYSSVGTSCLDIKVDVLSWASDDGKIKERFVQTVSGPVTLIDNNNKIYWVNGVPVSGPGYYYRLSERAKNEELKWSEWKPVNNSYIESLQNQVNSLQQQIESILNTINTIYIK